MLRLYGLAVVFWLCLFDVLTHLLGWRGLRWGSPALIGFTLAGTGWGGWRVLAQRRRGVLALLLAFVPALLLQVGVAAVRNYRLNPRRLIEPGQTSTRRIERLDVPGRHGAVPALHLVPHGGSPHVVCVAHGSGSDKYFYSWDLSAALLQQGMAVLLIDLDGHGESPRPQNYPQTVESFADVVVWLRERYARVSVVGRSLGGCIAAHTGAQLARPDALVVIGSPPFLHLSRDQVRREARGLLRPTVFNQFRYGSAYHLVRAWTTTPKQRSEIATDTLIRTLDLAGSLRQIGSQQPPLPLLLIYGQQDALVPPAAVDQVQQAMPPWATLHRLPSATHLSTMIDARTLRLVSTWLANQAAAGAG